MADVADSPAALNPAATAGRTNSGHRAGPRSALTARPAVQTAASSCVASSTRRRSAESAMDPPSSAPAISPGTWASDASPTASDVWVSA